ncbi:MAG: LacI family transcriptional regulator [Cyclobacteriaceae bacterium]|nr:LacI family transcriptional regulator [Cyclobacteriaceae bacterium]MDW8330579.1 LacI family DNA-binding transcriptional regulator [Cyclobacteriaceae bacterium]
MSSSKEVTIYDIAEALNISPATVSRGLKDHPGIRKDTKKKILEMARKMGYQHNTFASNLRRKSTNTIGIIVPRLNSYFMSTVIAGMEKVANENGYNVIISQSLESYKKEIASANTLFNSRVDGLIVSVASDTPDSDHFDMFFKKHIPLIFFDRVLERPGCTTIIIDNHRAGYDATRHLLDQGCRRIVHIAGNLNRNVYAGRLEGYKQALQERNIPYDPSLVISCNLTEQCGTQAARQILEMNPRPDGIFAANDTSVVACMRELKHAGIEIPGQLGVVGFNNDPISKVIEPNLTTINYPGQEMGEIAASTLINKITKSGNSSLDTIVLRHELIIRQSSLRK